jgi:hypothetical protein
MRIRSIRSFTAIVGLGCSLFGYSICLGASSSGSHLIEPGVRVGQVRVGANLAAVHRALGKPAQQDAAMGGKLTEVWRSGRALGGKATARQEELEIRFQGPGAGGDQSKPTVVVQIRVTSPYFKTASGISVNSSLAEIKKTYPHSREDKEWAENLPPISDKSPKEGLVDQDAGIAFEFQAGANASPDKAGYCEAIHIFRPGTTPLPMGSFDE